MNGGKGLLFICLSGRCSYVNISLGKDYEKKKTHKKPEKKGKGRTFVYPVNLLGKSSRKSS